MTTSPRTLSPPALKELRIVLPLPARALSPNARPNRWAKAKAVREYRNMAWAYARLALAEGGHFRAPRWERAETTATFYFATNRRRDADSCSSSLKSAWDGITDGGVVFNDAGLTHHPPELRIDKARPRVELTISEVI